MTVSITLQLIQTEEKKEINLKVSAEPAANLRTISEESALERNQETTKKQGKIISLVYQRKLSNCSDSSFA